MIKPFFPPHLDKIWALEKMQNQILGPLPTMWLGANYFTSVSLTYFVYNPTNRHARIKWENRFGSVGHKRILKIQILTVLLSRYQYTLNKNAKNFNENFGIGAITMKTESFSILQILAGESNEIKLQWADWYPKNILSINMLHYMAKRTLQ